MTSSAAAVASTDRGNGSRAGAAALASVVLLYGILAFVVFSPNAVYSVDVGVKYVQARSLVDHRFRSLDMTYRGEFLDGGRQFVPFRRPYVMNVHGRPQAIWSATTALLNAPFVAVWGYRGMILASIVAGAVVLWAAWRLSIGYAAAAVPVLLGLGTPLWFFSTIGWEHAPAVAFAMLAWVVAAGSARPRDAFYAGLLLGVGSTLRDEVVLLAPGLALAIWFRTRDVNAVLAAAGGVAAALLGEGIVEVAWFHRPLASHAASVMPWLRNQLHDLGISTPMLSTEPATFRDRYAAVVQNMLLGYYDDVLIGVVAVGLAFAVIVRWRWHVGMPMLIVIVALLVVAARDVWMLVAAPKWVAGLYRLSPFLLFAILPRPWGMADTDPRRLVTIGTLASYIAVGVIALDPTGGKGFPRLLLPLLPLLVVSAWQAIVLHLRAPRLVDRWIGRCGLGLAALALAIHLGGTIRAYAAWSAADGALVQYLDRADVPVLVADDLTTGALLLPLNYRKLIFLADTQQLANALSDTLANGRFGAVLLVSRDPQPRVVLPGYVKLDARSVGRMVVETWHR